MTLYPHEDPRCVFAICLCVMLLMEIWMYIDISIRLAGLHNQIDAFAQSVRTVRYYP
jgi:hypothetical protein